MPFFATAVEVDCYVGGALRMACANPSIGAELARAALSVQFACTDLPARITIDLYEPLTVRCDSARVTAEVEIGCTSDFLDAYMRGGRSLIDALAEGEVVAHGRVSKVLKILPVLEEAFPYYRQLVAMKPRTTTSISGVFR